MSSTNVDYEFHKFEGATMRATEKGKKERDGGTRSQTQRRVRLASKIFEEHGDFISRIIRFNLNDQTDAEDIFQNLFLSLVDKPIPAGIQNVKGYLYRAVTNDIIDARRRAKSYTTRIDRYSETCEDEDKGVNYKDPRSIVSQGEEKQEMFQLIKRHLPPRETEALVQRFGKDHGIDEGAKRMGVNKRTFSHYLCTGLKRIRYIISQNGSDINGCT